MSIVKFSSPCLYGNNYLKSYPDEGGDFPASDYLSAELVESGLLEATKKNYGIEGFIKISIHLRSKDLIELLRAGHISIYSIITCSKSKYSKCDKIDVAFTDDDIDENTNTLMLEPCIKFNTDEIIDDVTTVDIALVANTYHDWEYTDPSDGEKFTISLTPGRTCAFERLSDGMRVEREPLTIDSLIKLLKKPCLEKNQIACSIDEENTNIEIGLAENIWNTIYQLNEQADYQIEIAIVLPAITQVLCELYAMNEYNSDSLYAIQSADWYRQIARIWKTKTNTEFLVNKQISDALTDAQILLDCPIQKLKGGEE